ncbi:hypothetical protein BJ170DRAFT_638650 [Xylariales sp. AK1849]|nr:hypothetical protein BJ170DRAFT_638650 [Xylariales sp. AK1849]
MASPQLAIAKVSFSAVLLRKDPTSCPRNEIDEFFSLLDATLSRCSPVNVQKSKQWILHRLVQSPARVAALGKYFTALDNSFIADVTASREAREPSSKRKRLHVLYVLNDVLHHVQARTREDSFPSLLEPFLPALVQSAAVFPDCPKHLRKVYDLVNLWAEKGHFSPEFIEKLRDTIRNAPTLNPASAINGTTRDSAATGAKLPKDAPYIMPTMHGDASVPWYDLPAANWLPVIEPNSTRAMNPSMIKPLQFMPGPADKNLIKAVQDLLADVDQIYAKDHCLGEGPAEDVDQLGQRIVLDESTGHAIGGETYYGWSRTFCEKMKQRRKKGNGFGDDGRGRSLSRSQSRSSSRSSTHPAFKRRRMPDSRSPRSRSRSRSRRRSYSRERGRSRSYSNPRSPSPPRQRRFQRSRSTSQGYSPPPAPNGLGNSNNHSQPPNLSNPPPPFPSVPSNVFSPYGGAPPPPPNWQGPWPPPPPPPPPLSMGGAVPNPWMSTGVPPVPMGGWGASPVPPPPPPASMAQFNHQEHQHQAGQFHSGRGGRGDYRGGRGGWRGGRSGW